MFLSVGHSSDQWLTTHLFLDAAVPIGGHYNSDLYVGLHAVRNTLESLNVQRISNIRYNGPHSRTILTNEFVLKSHLQIFYEDS